MRNFRLIFSFILIFISLTSCYKGEGSCDGYTIPKHSRVADITSSANSIVILANKEDFWINQICLDNDCSFEYLSENEDFIAKESEFEVKIINQREIHISMSANPLESERNLIIYLRSGNCYENIQVIQSEK